MKLWIIQRNIACLLQSWYSQCIYFFLWKRVNKSVINICSVQSGGWGLCYKTLSYRNKFVLGFLTLNAFASTNSFSQLVQILSDPNVNRAQQIYQVSVSFINFYVICRPSKSWICNNSFTEQVPAHRDRALQAKNGLYVSLSLDWQSNCRRISRQLLLLLLLFLFLLLVQ